MKRMRAISLALLSILLLTLACGPEATPETTEAVQDAVDTAVALTSTARALGTEAAAPPSDTPGPTATNTPVPTHTNTPIPSPTPFCDRADFVSESIPDGMDFEPGTTFTKTWRLRNDGACTWNASYSLVFDHGDLLSAPTVVPLTGNVAPGQEVDLSVGMVAPSAEGTYLGHWMLRNSSGVLFGLGSNATLTFWIEIDVVEPSPIMVIVPFRPLFPGWLLPRTEQVYAQTTLTPGSTGYAEVSCPSGSLAVGGGFAADDGVVVYNSSPRPSGWISYGKNNTGSNRLLNAYAICLYNTAGSRSYEYQQVSVAPGGVNSARPTCPAGSVVTGGGFASDPNTMWVYTTLKSGDGWQTWAKNTSGTSQMLTSYAICLSGVSAATTQIFVQENVPAGGVGGDEATCPTNTLTTGGGYALSDGLATYTSSMKPADVRKWHAYAANTAPSPRLMNVYAICLSFP